MNKHDDETIKEIDTALAAIKRISEPVATIFGIECREPYIGHNLTIFELILDTNTIIHADVVEANDNYFFCVENPEEIIIEKKVYYLYKFRLYTDSLNNFIEPDSITSGTEIFAV